MHRPDLDSPAWQRFRIRVLARDGERCTIGRLLGGPCHPTLHVHHVIPVSEGGASFDIDNAVTACARHHPMLEALRQRLLAPTRRCSHRHPYPQGREACERRMRERAVA